MGGIFESNLSWIPYYEGLRAHHPLHVYHHHHHHVPHVPVPPLFLQHLPPLFHCEPCSVYVLLPPPVMRYWGSPRLYVGMPGLLALARRLWWPPPGWAVRWAPLVYRSCYPLSWVVAGYCRYCYCYCCSPHYSFFMPSYPSEIGLLPSPWMLLLATVSLAVVLVMMMDVSLQALLRSSASLAGWNYPISPIPPSLQW